MCFLLLKFCLKLKYRSSDLCFDIGRYQKFMRKFVNIFCQSCELLIADMNWMAV